jgi:hypothetical protein
LIAGQTVAHEGILGKEFSLAAPDSPSVFIMALKKAEKSEKVVLRVREISGNAVPAARITFPCPVEEAQELNGFEENKATPGVEIDGNAIAFAIKGYEPKTFALKLGTPVATAPAANSRDSYNAILVHGVGGVNPIIRIELHKDEKISALAVCDLSGKVRCSISAAQDTRSFVWNGSDNRGERLPAGFYCVQIRTTRTVYRASVSILR